MKNKLYTKAIIAALNVDFIETQAEFNRYVAALYNAMIWGEKC